MSKRFCQWVEQSGGLVSVSCGKPATSRLLRWPFYGSSDYCDEHGEAALRSSMNVALVPDAAGVFPDDEVPS